MINISNNYFSTQKIGGLNNSNYLISIHNFKYVLRIPSKDNKNNFNYENKILNIIKPFNISPKIIYHNKYTGFLLSEYIESNRFNIDFYNSTFFLNMLSDKLKKLHKLQSTNSFSPFDHIYNNINTLININYEFNHDINLLINKLHTLQNSLEKNIHYGLCHNDLNTSNILYTNYSVFLIDFEFSGMGDIFFDLATISWFLKDEMQNELIKIYFGYFDVNLKNKLNDYLYVVKLWNATWSYVKSINSNSDYDYKLAGNIILDDLINSI